MRTRPIFVRALVLAAGTVASFAFSQEQRPQVPTFRGGVDAVLVDVVVVDRDGKPVSGLERDDFQVLEDGVPQTIATFDVTDWTSYVGERVDGASAEGDVNTYPRRFIFIVNRQGAEFEYLTRAKRDLATFIVESTAEGDEAMVIDVGYSLKVVQDFQAGKEHTLQAVRELSQMQVDYPLGPDRAAHQMYRDLESLGQALLGIPGRKVVILFSNELFTFAAAGSRSMDNSFSLRKAVEALNQANTAVYTLDIRGADSTFNSFHGGLSPLATETGGRYFRNNPSFNPPLRRIGAENQRYYLLSYVSTNPELDGSYRKIEVKVARESADVIARPGYFAREREAVPTDAPEENAADSPDAPLRGELPLAVELSTYLLPRDGAVHVPVSVALPADLLTGEGGAERTLTLNVTDESGKILHSVEEPVSTERFYMSSSFSLVPGTYLLEVIVSAGERELHRASTGIRVPPGLGDRFGLSSILPVTSKDAAASLGAGALPLLPVSAVRRGDPLNLLFYILPGREPESKRARVSYRILDPEGSEVLKDRVKEEIHLSDAAADGRPVTLSLPTRSLAYGAYRVEVRIEDPSSGRAATSEIEFRVR